MRNVCVCRTERVWESLHPRVRLSNRAANSLTEWARLKTARAKMDSERLLKTKQKDKKHTTSQRVASHRIVGNHSGCFRLNGFRVFVSLASCVFVSPRLCHRCLSRRRYSFRRSLFLLSLQSSKSSSSASWSPSWPPTLSFVSVVIGGSDDI